MKHLINICICLITLHFLNSCSSSEINNLTNADSEKSFVWIEGNYTLKSPYGAYYENWKKLDSLNYNGFGYFMDSLNIDTLFRQAIYLEKKNADVFMYFNVKNQNDNKTVEFKMTKNENQVFTFENSFRDYPSIITYKLISDTSVNIVMKGFKKGKEKKEDFIITK